MFTIARPVGGERRELHEDRGRDALVGGGEPDAGPAGGAGARVDHLDGVDHGPGGTGLHDLGEPLGGELFDLDGNRHGRHVRGFPNSTSESVTVGS